jgi:Tetratricopeptide repeat
VLTKIWLVAMVFFTLLYAFLLFERGIVLISDPQPVAIALGLAILFFPITAVAAIFFEVRFGFRLSKISKLVQKSNIELPEYDLKASGRADHASGKAAFEAIQGRIQEDEENYLLWFLLADAYDKLGDRKRARAAARKSISLAKEAKAL